MLLRPNDIISASRSANALMEGRDVKLDPDLQPIRTLKEIDMICHLWQQYTSIALLPLSNTSVTVRREMSIFHNQTISRVEGGANTMLQRAVDGPCSLMADAMKTDSVELRTLF